MPVWHPGCHASEAIFQGGERPKPRQRGTKRPPQKRNTMMLAGLCTDGLDALWQEGAQGLEQASVQATLKMQELGGVRGAIDLKHRCSRRNMPSMLPLVVLSYGVR